MRKVDLQILKRGFSFNSLAGAANAAKDLLFSPPVLGPAEQVRRNLARLILLRVVILSVVLAITSWGIVTGASGKGGQTTLFIFIAFTYGISALNALFLRIAQNIRMFGYLQLSLDITLASLAIVLSGSPITISLYLLIIVGAAVIFGSHGALIVAVFSAACFLGVASQSTVILNNPSFSFTYQTYALLFFTLIVFALVIGFLAKQFEHIGKLAKQHEKNFSDLSEQQRQLFNDLSEGIITTDLENAITSINQAAQAILGLTELDAKQLQARNLTTLLSEFGIDNAKEVINKTNPGGDAAELSLSSGSSNDKLRLRYTLRPLTDSDNVNRGKILIFNDVSHVRSIEERLSLHERMTELLAEKEPSGSTFSIPAGSVQMIGESPVMQRVFALVERVSLSDASVLISGESGTGKELIARAIHTQSNRSKRPFVAVNCGAIPENLIESELFGHKKGSFTGAISDNLGLFKRADTGTIFLDEIGELPLSLQTKLLRVLQDKKVRSVGDVVDVPLDVRIVAATNKHLRKEIEHGKFREDLYYRLNVVNIIVPPLRERKEDIPVLVRHFLGKLCDPDSVLPRISPEALQMLMNHNFPGNVRELENIIERALVLGGQAILADHLPAEVAKGIGRGNGFTNGHGSTSIKTLPINLEDELSALEKDLLLQALEASGGVKKQAAKLLGLNFRSFRYRLKKYQSDEDAEYNSDQNDDTI